MSHLSKELTEIIPFNWECTFCGWRMTSAGDIYNEKDIFGYFENPISVEDLNNVALLRGNYESQNVLKNMIVKETTAIICSIEGRCENPKCRAKIDLKLWVELKLEEKDQELLYFSVSGVELIDGDFIKLYAQPGFYRGLDIAGGLNKLYLRWWYLGGKISVICPFIGKKELKYFDDIGIQIIKIYNSLSAPSSHPNPFQKIITRKFTGYYEIENGKSVYKRTTISELINLYLKEIDTDKIFLDGQSGSGLIFVMNNTLFEVENIPRIELPDHHKYANYFHGKFYGACLDDHAEMVITSYNYTVAETLQLESLAFVETTKTNFNRQIEIFEKDQHMTINPVNLSDIL